MFDLDNEEQLAKLIKQSCEPVAPSSRFQNRLRNILMSEVGRRSTGISRRLWVNPLVWASVAAAVALIIFAYSLLNQSDLPPILMPDPSTPSVVTPNPSIEQSSEPTSVTSPTVNTTSTPTSTTPPMLVSTGILEMRVIDAPPKRDVSSIVVTISNIQVQQNSDEPEEEWLPVIEGPVSFDLIYLKEQGIEGLLGNTELDTGDYNQIKMDVTLDEAVIDGETVNEGIIFPSEVLKIVGAFYVEENITTLLVFDFDAEKSLVFTGEGKVMFKPVVKLIIINPE